MVRIKCVIHRNMQFRDSLVLDAPHKTQGGFMAVRARAARTGVYEYAGSVIDPDNAHGLRDQAIVRVLRDEATVFDTAAVHSFIGKPITDDHPSVAVTAANWRDYARGTVMGALRDGDYLAFDLLLTDAATIAKVEAGKRELSNGYGADLEFGSFTAKDGTACQARQSRIHGGNHVALVDQGRAGPECAIKDSFALCDALTASELARLNSSFTDERNGTMPHTLIVDGLQVPNVSDEAKACIEKLQGQLKDSVEGRAADKAAHDKALGTKDAEIDGLKAKVLDEATIDALADAKAEIVAKTKALLGDSWADTRGKSLTDIRRMAVAKKFGDAAVKDKSDDYVEARFDAMVADVKATQPGTAPVFAADAAGAEHQAWVIASDHNAWRTAGQA